MGEIKNWPQPISFTQLRTLLNLVSVACQRETGTVENFEPGTDFKNIFAKNVAEKNGDFRSKYG
jgi:hypothetical protein